MAEGCMPSRGVPFVQEVVHGTEMVEDDTILTAQTGLDLETV